MQQVGRFLFNVFIIRTAIRILQIAPAGTLSFAPGERDKAITVKLIGNAETESVESFEVVIMNADGIEALPAPMQIRVLPAEPSLPGWQSDGIPNGLVTRVSKIMRLKDGRVLV